MKQELLKQKNKILHALCELEFEEKGFKKILDDKQISYKLFYRTPLGKLSQWQMTVGILRQEFNKLMKEEILIIFGLTNPLNVDSFVYYVYNFNEGKGGYSSNDEYIDIKRKNNVNNRWETLLPTIEEFIENGKEKKEKTKD